MTARITYVGHATVLIELAGIRLLTDPILRPRVFGIIRRASPAPDIGPPPDAVLLSHLHPDHLDYRSLRGIGTGTPVIAARGSARLLRRHGLSKVTELERGESTSVGDTQVLATRAVHDGRRYPIGPSVPALGYEIRAAGQRIYFAGDTDLFDEMAELAGVDIALLPIAGWGQHVGEGHLDPDRAAQAAALIQPRVVVPIHWGTVLRADLHRRRPDLLTTPAEKLRARMAELAPGVETRVLQPGESFALDP